jgi:hypothetical protein
LIREAEREVERINKRSIVARNKKQPIKIEGEMEMEMEMEMGVRQRASSIHSFNAFLCFVWLLNPQSSILNPQSLIFHHSTS